MNSVVTFKTRYYVAQRSEDGLIKIVCEELGPYYDTEILIHDRGYATREAATDAVEDYCAAYKKQFGQTPYFTFFIHEEITATPIED